MGGPIPAVLPPQVQEDAPTEDQVTLSQIYSAILEIRDSQQRLEQNQQRLGDAQIDTNHRITALTEQIHTLDCSCYGRRPRVNSPQVPPAQN